MTSHLPIQWVLWVPLSTHFHLEMKVKTTNTPTHGQDSGWAVVPMLCLFTHPTNYYFSKTVCATTADSKVSFLPCLQYADFAAGHILEKYGNIPE